MSVAAPTHARLAEVEVRKMTDTRSGRWLLAVVALAGVALVVVTLTSAPQDDRTWVSFFSASMAGVAVLFPVVGVVAVTSEWSQRTAPTTFALIPDRRRVVSAKLTATLALTVLAVVIAFVVATAGRGVGEATGRASGAWSLPAAALTTIPLAGVLGIWTGVAFGLLLRSAPLAIVAYFGVPTVWGILTDLISSARPAAGWLDPGRAMDPLYEAGMTGGEWARLSTAMALWLMLPLLAGVARLTRSEVN